MVSLLSVFSNFCDFVPLSFSFPAQQIVPGSSCSGGWGIFLAAMVVDDEVIGVVDVGSIIKREELFAVGLFGSMFWVLCFGFILS